MGDVPRPRASSGSGAPSPTAPTRRPRDAGGRAVRLPDLSAQADRRLPAADPRLLNEYCVEFPDETRPYGIGRLPDSDDVLAKWMALTGDERRLISTANMHLPGRQVDPKQVRRDLWRLAQWERARLAAQPRRGRRLAP